MAVAGIGEIIEDHLTRLAALFLRESRHDARRFAGNMVNDAGRGCARFDRRALHDEVHRAQRQVPDIEFGDRGIVPENDAALERQPSDRLDQQQVSLLVCQVRADLVFEAIHAANPLRDSELRLIKWTVGTGIVAAGIVIAYPRLAAVPRLRLHGTRISGAASRPEGIQHRRADPAPRGLCPGLRRNQASPVRRHASKGFSTAAPRPSTSDELRVTRIMSWTRTVAASSASATGTERIALIRPQTSATRASMGRTRSS